MNPNSEAKVRRAPDCPVHGLKASTAYRRRACRCAVCTEWQSYVDRRKYRRDASGVRARVARYKARHPDRVSESQQRYRERHRERIQARKREHYHRNREALLSRRRMDKYGVTIRQVEAQVRAQGGKCANPACDTSVNVRSHVDHCHETGAVRGILCLKCNWIEGMIANNPGRVCGIMQYVQQGGVWVA